MKKPIDRSDQFTEDEHVDTAIRQAAQRAIADHKRRGAWIAIWRDGKVVHLPPEEIPHEEDAQG
ncbi:MAG: hypothetical protein JST35_00715 [Armatimonadetes bacterium]|jgi:hypothetical protein|nr:hypothetical protein [Armatimonadota bacterium]